MCHNQKKVVHIRYVRYVKHSTSAETRHYQNTYISRFSSQYIKPRVAGSLLLICHNLYMPIYLLYPVVRIFGLTWIYYLVFSAWLSFHFISYIALAFLVNRHVCHRAWRRIYHAISRINTL